MFRLPLFPLPVVLFPGAYMPLHVFEPRYRQMMAHCLEGDRRFGLVYHDADRSGPFRMEEQVGCVAEILEFQPIPDGRSLVLTRGGARFRIEDGIESPAMYYEALIEEYLDTDANGHAIGIRERREVSIELVMRVIERLAEASESVELDPEHETSFQIAPMIGIDPAWQQELLLLRDERLRLDRIDALLRTVLRSAE